MPVRCATGASAHGAGAPGRQVGGRGITWGGTGRDIPRTLPAPCSPPAGTTAPGGSTVPGYDLAEMTSPADLQAQADALHWYHTIDLGNGVVTKGDSAQDEGTGVIPDVAGRSVLDIGAWDGKYSFQAERAGAARVVALDHYAWGVDFAARGAYWAECIERGALPDQSRDETDFWQPDLPGRRGFELAKAALGSGVEPLVADFQTVDLAGIGQFDVVLYLGVLYHMKEPLTCLERVRAVTKEVAVIETEAVHMQGHEGEVLMQFHAGSSLRTDFGNWYVPTIDALHNLCRAAGFSQVHTVVGPPPAPLVAPAGGARHRLTRRIGGLPVPGQSPASPTSAPSANYRAVVHAFA
jgi:tRNA (mo5U34)-methyltransferase